MRNSTSAWEGVILDRSEIEQLNRDRRLVAMRNSPNDVLWTERGVAAEENSVARTHHGLFIDNRTFPFIEFNTDVAFDPWECIVLADRKNDVVAGNRHFACYGAAINASLLINVVLHQLEGHANELAVLKDEFLG